ncbi:MAG: MarR family transcriptional regulator [Spirochaetales bacterium]|nr:MarR family transcriptional regulator [Spirochaetales bacterium]
MAIKKLCYEWINSGDTGLKGFDGFISYNLLKVADKLHYRLHKIVNEFGINPQEYSIILALQDCSGCNQVTLGKLLGIDTASMVKFVDSLEKLEIVERRIGKDKRERLLSLTNNGVQILEEIKPLIQQSEKEFFNILGDEGAEAFYNSVEKLLTLSN